MKTMIKNDNAMYFVNFEICNMNKFLTVPQNDVYKHKKNPLFWYQNYLYQMKIIALM